MTKIEVRLKWDATYVTQFIHGLNFFSSPTVVAGP